MKEFLPTFTFGFLMAQLFPGATVVLSLSCGFVTFVNGVETGLLRLFAIVGDMWFGSLRNTIVFLFLSIASGVLLHGLDWMALGGMYKDHGGGPRTFPFHKWCIFDQIVTAPFNMIYELLVLVTREGLDEATVGENAAKIDPTLIPNLNYLQEFYLHFAQFFIHMAYALWISLIVLMLWMYQVGFSMPRMILLLLIYGILSVFFLMGRAQLAILFEGERALITRSDVIAGAGNKTAAAPVEVKPIAIAVEVKPVAVEVRPVAVDVKPVAVEVKPIEVQPVAVAAEVKPVAVEVKPAAEPNDKKSGL
jgi:hypothetical protein